MSKTILLALCFVGLYVVNGYILKQVTVLSRHNVRTPLITNIGNLSPKIWPKWNGETGYLTPKGNVLEGYMGTYFAEWLKKERVLSNDCPTDDAVLIYSNSKQRTKATAKAFAASAFPKCNVTVKFVFNDDVMDPIFHPILHNSSVIFKEETTRNMKIKLDLLDLMDEYFELERIIDFKNSPICKTESVCDLNAKKNEIVAVTNMEPDINGPLQIGNSVVDAILMAYYDGFPLDDVGWGEVRKPEQWKNLIKVSTAYHNIRFHIPISAKDISKPLLRYMTEVFSNSNRKFTVLIGHDANIYTILSSLGFKEYDLDDQYEKTPIGGKIVFQKWYDEVGDRDLLKINYVYQSTRQLRESEILSLDNPPRWKILELHNCVIDDDGFCPWNDFVNILKHL